MSESYLALSHTARSLLVEIAMQFMGTNNGQLLAGQAKLRERGWRSADTLHRAKAELIKHEFIFETVKGGRPNRASWYAVTWWRLDAHPRYDFGVEQAFRRVRAPQKNSSPTPRPGGRLAPTAPIPVAPAPSDGAIRRKLPADASPSDGDHLEMPSQEPAGTSKSDRANTAGSKRTDKADQRVVWRAVRTQKGE